MKKKTITAIMLLCVSLSMGCLNEPLDTPANVFVEKPDKVDVLSIEETISYSDITKYVIEDWLTPKDLMMDVRVELAELDLIENRTWQEEQRWNELKFELLYPRE